MNAGEESVMTESSYILRGDVIEGGCILLRPITMEDTPLIVRWRNMESVRRNFIFRETFTAEMHTRWMQTRVAAGEVLQYIIVERESGRSVGSVYFRDMDRKNRSAEYGIFIGEESARGRGIGSETAHVFTDYGFQELGLHRISLRLLADNVQAEKSYSNAGFEREGLFRDMVFLDGEYRDVLFMAKLNREAER